MENKIINQLKTIHKKYRLSNATTSEHTKSAQKITKKWQKLMQTKVKGTIKSEVSINKKSYEKIDIVDFKNCIAYELKVSGKNVQHEIYKDIFKIIRFNDYLKNKKITKLIFISEEKGIKKLENRIDVRFLKMLKRKHKLELELVSI